MRFIKKIMIVDDDPAVIAITKRALERTGRYTVVFTSKGANAGALAKEEAPDLILLDINLPDMEGGAVARSVSQMEETKDIPILFLTGIATEEDIDQRGGIIGGRPMIAKTVGLKKIIERIDAMVRH